MWIRRNRYEVLMHATALLAQRLSKLEADVALLPSHPSTLEFARETFSKFNKQCADWKIEMFDIAHKYAENVEERLKRLETKTHEHARLTCERGLERGRTGDAVDQTPNAGAAIPASASAFASDEDAYSPNALSPTKGGCTYEH